MKHIRHIHIKKNLFFLFIVVRIFNFLPITAHSAILPCEIAIDTTWKEIEIQNDHANQSKWVLVCIITFKKRTKEPIVLTTLDIAWHGPTVEKLYGELFRTEPHKPFLPIEETWISDSVWQKHKQNLHFNFAHQEHLGSFSQFCLVLTVPKPLENKLQHGSFTIAQSSLPYPLGDTPKQTLSFSLKPNSMGLA